MDQEVRDGVVPQPEEGLDASTWNTRHAVDKFTPPQQVTLRIGDQQIGTFAATSRERRS